MARQNERARLAAGAVGLHLPSDGAAQYTTADADRLDLAVPNELRPLKGWLLWQRGQAKPGGKFDKIPCYASGGKRFGTQGSPEDRTKLVSFDEALAVLRQGGYDGIGLAMLDWGIVGLDFDGCRGGDDNIERWVSDLCRDTYMEISPSGTGIRAFYRGAFPDRKNHEARIEVFCRQGFLTVTGARLNGCDLAKMSDATAGELTRRLGPDKARSNSAAVVSEACAKDPVLARLNERGLILRDKGGGKFDITCPFEASHTTPGGGGDTVYFVPHTGGYASGNLDCKHSHCAERPQAEFRVALGLGDSPSEGPPVEAYEQYPEAHGMDSTANAKASGEGQTGPSNGAAPGGLGDGEERAESPPQSPSYPPIPPLDALRIDLAELATASLTPQCVVEHYLYADVAVLTGPGGTGKTTLALWEAAHIALERPLYGFTVHTPGTVVFVTAEDRRELLIARLRALMEEMALNAEERAAVCARVLIWDVSGSTCRLAELDGHGNVALTGLADAIVERFRDAQPVLVELDPAISFGAGERIINDNEHALILAARRIVRGLGCCVRLIAHTGKENARSGLLDQYTARGGSALPDGSRMVTVLRPFNPEAVDDKLIPPPGLSFGDGEQVIVLARPKLSFAPLLPLIWITRRGYTFRHFVATRTDPETEAKARADQVWRYLIDQLASGSRHTKKTLEDSSIMPQAKLRAALASLIAVGRVIYAELPEELRHGGRKDYLHPAAPTSSPPEAERNEVGQKSDPTSSPPEAAPTSSLPYREKFGDEVEVTDFSPPAYHLGDEWQRGSDEVDEVEAGKAIECETGIL